MASMTDIVFLLLVFFMVTSTFIFPTALEVNLPQSTEQTQLKPMTRVYVMADSTMYGAYDDQEPVRLATPDALVSFLKEVQKQDEKSGIAVYGDAGAPYGLIIDVLNLGALNDLKMVLATTPRPADTDAGRNARAEADAAQAAIGQSIGGGDVAAEPF